MTTYCARIIGGSDSAPRALTATPMSKIYHSTQFLEIALGGASLEIGADIEFGVEPYTPAQGPSYASGGQPAEGGCARDIRCKAIFVPEVKPVHKPGKDVMGQPRRDLELPAWLCDWIEENVDAGDLYAEAVEHDRVEEDAAADYRAEMQREDREYERAHPSAGWED